MYWNCHCPPVGLRLNYSNPPMAFIQEVVYAESDPEALCGQEHRSGENFTGSGNYQITAPAGISFNIKIDKSLGKDDPVLGNLRYSNGSTVFLQDGTNYYIADPEGAVDPFTVIFTTIVPPRPGQKV